MRTSKPTILIIENGPLDDEIFKSILGKDHQLIFATGRQEVIEFDGHHRIDLVLLNIGSSGVEPDEIYGHLRANPANCNTDILLIVDKDEEGHLRDMPAGVTDCLAKPLQPPIVAARVQSHLMLKRYRDLLEGTALNGSQLGTDSLWQFETLLAHEWRRSLRNQTPISLVLVDIDFGIQAGAQANPGQVDAGLQAVGEVLRQCVKRNLDLIASYKTHPFACLLPDTDAAGTRRVCKQIHEKMAQLTLPAAGQVGATQISLRLGTATLLPRLKMEPEELLCQAERMLEETGQPDLTKVTA